MSWAENRTAHIRFRLEEEASRAVSVGQNFLLARDLVLLLETAWPQQICVPPGVKQTIFTQFFSSF